MSFLPNPFSSSALMYGIAEVKFVIYHREYRKFENEIEKG